MNFKSKTVAIITPFINLTIPFKLPLLLSVNQVGLKVLDPNAYIDQLQNLDSLKALLDYEY